MLAAGDPRLARGVLSQADSGCAAGRGRESIPSGGRMLAQHGAVYEWARSIGRADLVHDHGSGSGGNSERCTIGSLRFVGAADCVFVYTVFLACDEPPLQVRCS